MRKVDTALQDQLKKLIVSMGYEFIGCEYVPQGRQVIFRLYIDKQDGLTLKDCSLVSHQVSGLLDVLDPIQAKYSLEVSSPGIDRPLFEIEHYRQQVGKQVKIRLYSAIEGNQRNLKGILHHVEDDVIYLLLENDKQTIKLAFAQIEKANLIGDIH